MIRLERLLPNTFLRNQYNNKHWLQDSRLKDLGPIVTAKYPSSPMTPKTPASSVFSEHKIILSPMAVFLTCPFQQLFMKTPITNTFLKIPLINKENSGPGEI